MGGERLDVLDHEPGAVPEHEELDAGLFRDDTVAISFQNGLGNEEMISRP